jgi:PKD repeat protein
MPALPTAAVAASPFSPVRLFVAAAALLVLLASSASAVAASVNLAWNPVAGSSVRGYRVYIAPASASLTQPPKAPVTSVDVGASTTHSVTGLADGTAYKFAVTAYDAGGSESGFSNLVSVTPSSVPVAGFVASTTSGPAPLALNFVNESTGTIASYAWTFGDGTTSTSASPTKVYSSPGTYTVSLKVTGAAGSDTLTRSNYVTVGASSSGTPLLAKTFDSGTLAGWSVHDQGTVAGPSDWRISSGKLVQLSNIYDGILTATDLAKRGTYLLYDGGMAWTNYRVKFRMRANDNDAQGLMFRYGDANNYYRFSWDRERGYRRLVKNVNGVFTKLAADTASYAKFRDYEVEIVASGTLIEVWIDGTRIFRVSDAARAKGSIAFYSWSQAGAYFDNLIVQ